MIGAQVEMWGTRIGTVVQEDFSSIPRFNYDDRFLKSGIEVSPLMMPLSSRVYSFPTLNHESFYGLPGLLADSLPDKFGTAVLERYFSEQGRDIRQISAVERLCYTGLRGMGALEYLPAIDLHMNETESIHVEKLVKMASEILSDREKLHIPESDHAMQQIIDVGTSAGGARAKAVIAWNRDTKDIRSGQINAGDGYEYWLIKFDGVKNNKDHSIKEDGQEFTRIEYAYYLMATAAGIEMSPCELYQESGLYHFMTKRFDRIEPKGEKLHMQTLGALAHFDYKNPGAHSYEQVSQIIYQLQMTQKEIEQFYRRMVFNVIARNQDDHVKNISFLMDKNGRWSLSPAYDITYAVDPESRWLKQHQMSINGKTDHISMEDLLAAGKHMNISKNRSTKIIDEVLAAVLNWSAFGRQAFVSNAAIEGIERNLMRL